MRTTVELPDGIFRRAKRVALERGLSLKEFFTEAIERSLREPPRSARMTAPPIAAGGGPTVPARTNAELAALLEAEDTVKAG